MYHIFVCIPFKVFVVFPYQWHSQIQLLPNQCCLNNIFMMIKVSYYVCCCIVLLLGGQVAASAATISTSKVTKAWMILAWVSTVAGNLTLLGSAANLIVCEQARHAPSLAYNLTFWRHFKFGLPSTLIVTAIGLFLIRG